MSLDTAMETVPRFKQKKKQRAREYIYLREILFKRNDNNMY